MSLENHPNFHAVKFATDVISSYYRCVRGNYITEHEAPNVHGIIVEFVGKIEEIVDKEAEITKQRRSIKCC